MQKLKQKLKNLKEKIAQARGAVAFVAVVVTSLLLAFIAFGYVTDSWRFVPVRTGSMEPNLPKGSVAFTRPTSEASLKKGDVILFHAPTESRPLTVHRIYKIETIDGVRYYQTKGDANNGPDPWRMKLKSGKIWKVRSHIPKLGSFVFLFRTREVRLGVLALAGFVMIFLGMRAIWRKDGGSKGNPPKSGRDVVDKAPIGSRTFDDIAPKRQRPAVSSILKLGNSITPRSAWNFLRPLFVVLMVFGLTPWAFAIFTDNESVSATYSTGTLNAPSPLTCQWTSSTQITLSWLNNSPTFTDSYDVRRSNTSGSGYATLANVTPATTTTYVDAPSPVTTPRYYVIRANKGTWNATSNEKASGSCKGGIIRIAGTGAGGFSGDGGQATLAQLSGATGVTFDASGNLYIADQTNRRVRKVDTAGVISTIAGTGANCAAAAPGCGDGGFATAAQLSSPREVAFDTVNNLLYISDAGADRIRVINMTTNVITTYVGTGVAGFSGDGGLATAARLRNPEGMDVDPSGNLYFADHNNHRIRRVILATGIISTYAGNGVSGFAGDGGAPTAARLSSPFDVSRAATGELYIADRNNKRIRMVNAAATVISTVAGNGTGGFAGDGGAATAARLNNPESVYVSGTAFWIGDTANRRVRQVNAGTITTIAGTGANSSTGDNGPAILATFRNPTDVRMDSAGNLLVADRSANNVRSIAGPLP